MREGEGGKKKRNEGDEVVRGKGGGWNVDDGLHRVFGSIIHKCFTVNDDE